jgi:nicotinate-nucleotide adenylyltransferase
MIQGTRIGILGGTFDPVHVGHLETALAAARAVDLERVLLVPSGTPPHRHQEPAASRFHRFAMTALAVLGREPLVVSDLEIAQSGPSYTFDTLARLHATGLTRSQLFFITGADAFAEIDTWSRYPQVLEMAHFVVVSRPGYPADGLQSALPALAGRMRGAAGIGTATRATASAATENEILLVDARTPDVSSTEIRRRAERGESIHGLVPAAVETYIYQHGLYSRAGAIATPADHLHE